MKIGFSLPLGYLTGNAGPFENAFGPAGECLALLKDHGVGIVELGSYGADASSEDLMAAGNAVAASGLKVSLHSYLPSAVRGSELRDAYPNHFPLMERLAEHQGETTIVLHGHSTSGPSDSTALAESTRQALNQLSRIIDARKMPVRVALEIMRYHSDICDPCITYPGLLDIARDVDSTKVGFCWDIGHALSSVAQDRLELDPPSEFLRRVIHVHVHDVAPDGDTHWPLTDNPLLVHIIRKLVTAGYRGVYNLELSPPRWPPGTDVRAKALESIQRLQDDIIEEADD